MSSRLTKEQVNEIAQKSIQYNVYTIPDWHPSISKLEYALKLMVYLALCDIPFEFKIDTINKELSSLKVNSKTSTKLVNFSATDSEELTKASFRSIITDAGFFSGPPVSIGSSLYAALDTTKVHPYTRLIENFYLEDIDSKYLSYHDKRIDSISSVYNKLMPLVKYKPNNSVVFKKFQAGIKVLVKNSIIKPTYVYLNLLDTVYISRVAATYRDMTFAE